MFERKNDMYSTSDKFRSKRESQTLCDLGNTVEEKYGDRGWKLALRKDIEFSVHKNAETIPEVEKEGAIPDDDKIVIEKVNMGNTGVDATTRDDRRKRIDIIRRTMIVPTPPLT